MIEQLDISRICPISGSNLRVVDSCTKRDNNNSMLIKSAESLLSTIVSAATATSVKNYSGPLVAMATATYGRNRQNDTSSSTIRRYSPITYGNKHSSSISIILAEQKMFVTKNTHITSSLCLDSCKLCENPKIRRDVNSALSLLLSILCLVSLPLWSNAQITRSNTACRGNIKVRRKN